MGDVCRHGTEAAEVAALARYILRAEATRHRSPATVLDRLNDARCRSRTGAADARRVLREWTAVIGGPLQAMLQRYIQAVFPQLARNAACNRSHHTRQRCAF
ncbi:Stage II sporulation protein E (SpoIIE) [Lentzea xinjiangensis]|uniref:Stage II sporulation protein E (SpoIIE) n=2 Tax=Lentzea xinjiangensis TaxID=402600 RepID=A0A1H9RWA7_9PSEU|nr:Stage II sporulation protein E (SpoIIE) [Lentzea xinjiangensis]